MCGYSLPLLCHSGWSGILPKMSLHIQQRIALARNHIRKIRSSRNDYYTKPEEPNQKASVATQ
jgi:hypothetical protein